MPQFLFVSSHAAFGVDTPWKQERASKPDSSKNALFSVASFDIL